MGLALAAVAMSGAWLCTVHAGGKERGRRIEFSDPKSEEVTTNLHQLTSKKDSLKQLEEDLSKSMRTFSGQSSLDAVPAPPAQPPSGPVILNKRAKELLERRKNLIFLSPEDLVPTPSAEEVLSVPEYGPDGLEKKKKPPIELYYERLDAKRAASLKAAQSQDEDSFGRPNLLSGREVATPRGDPDLPGGLKEREQALKKIFQTEAADTGLGPAPARRSSFSDIFGLGVNAPSREKALEHKKLMEEFQSILEFSRPPTASADAPGLPGSSPELPHAWVNPFAPPGTSSMGNSPLGSINPIFAPSGVPDVNAQALGQSSVTPLLPKVEPPRSPPAPTFIAPKRPF